MSHSIRFLGLAVMAWAGVRALSLGVVPGAEALAFDRPPAPPMSTGLLPPVATTAFAPIEPMAQAPMPAMAYGAAPAYPAYPAATAYPVYQPYPVYMPMPAAQRVSVPRERDEPELAPPENYFDRAARPAPWPELALAAPVPSPQVTPSFEAARIKPGFDRIQLSTWAMLRGRPGLFNGAGKPGSSLAGAGTLGGSQAGARLLWRFDPHLAASLRTTAAVNSVRGGEAALGVRYQPFLSIPVAITAERRKSFGLYGGRDAFALFAEGGLYDQALPWNSSLDAYLQTGIVGAKSRDWFVDGSAAVSRPLWRNLSAGVGVWGGAQPGLSRIDAGPRLSLKVRRSMRVHLDYRHKLAGNAQPGSGAVLTVAGDF